MAFGDGFWEVFLTIMAYLYRCVVPIIIYYCDILLLILTNP